MDQGPLVNEQIEAGARFLAEFQKYAPILAAFWLKGSENGRWWLYVASEQITGENFDLAYGEVARLYRTLQDPQFDPFAVKVIGADHRLAKAAVARQQRYGGRTPPRVRGDVFGGVSVDEVYFYPTPIPVPA
jgi:hypothetical protein